jgi:thioredoxin-related protein
MKYAFRTFLVLMLISLTVSAQNPAATIPDFTFFKLNRSPFTSKDLELGKRTFFVFFDSDCEHCQHAVLNISKHYQEFKKTNIYLITLDSQEKISHFMTEYGSHLIDKKNVMILQDLKNDFLTKFKPRKYPSMFLFSPTGKLISYEDNEENIFSILKQINP